jgi:hypothetical protein
MIEKTQLFFDREALHAGAPLGRRAQSGPRPCRFEQSLALRVAHTLADEDSGCGGAAGRHSATGTNATTLRGHVLRVAERVETELGEERSCFIDGCSADWAKLPIPEGRPRRREEDRGPQTVRSVRQQQFPAMPGCGEFKTSTLAPTAASVTAPMLRGARMWSSKRP